MSLDISKIILLKKLHPHNFKNTKFLELNIKIKEFDFIIGTIILYAGTLIPHHWLLCDGSLLLIEEYEELFNIIGNVYGGDGITNFKLPDFRGRVPIGKGNNYSIGNYGGSETHTLLIDELPEHNFNGITTSSGLHNHTGNTSLNGEHIHDTNSINDQYNEYGLIHKSYGGNNTSNGLNLGEKIDNPDLVTTPLKLDVYTSGSHQHTITNDGEHIHNFNTNNIGLNKPHNIMQPYTVMNYLIKFK